VKLQAIITGDYSDSGSDVLVDVPGAAFAQKTATGDDTLEIYPGIAETANESVSSTLPREIQVVFTVGGTTPSFVTNLIVHWIG
jgi:hypothetical protein